MALQFIAVPIGAPTDFKWLGVFRRLGEPGYKIFWCAAVLAEMAAKTNSGGRLVDGQGQPKSPTLICAELGVEAVWAEETLFPVLAHLAEGHWGNDGAWVCTSPMVLRTLEWQGGDEAVKALPAPKSGSGKLQFSKALTESEYKAWQRNCRLPEGVYLVKACPKRARHGAKSCPVLAGKVSVCPNTCPDSENGHKRTCVSEDTEIVDDNECPFSPNIKEVKEVKKQQQANPDTPVVVFDQSHPVPQNLQAAKDLLEDLPPSARSDTLLTLLAKCLAKGENQQALRDKVIKAKGKEFPGAYLCKDLKALLNPQGRNDWDAAKREEEKQKSDQREAAEAVKRAEAARQDQLEAESKAKDDELYRRYLKLPLANQQAIKAAVLAGMEKRYYCFDPSGPGADDVLREEIIFILQNPQDFATYCNHL